MLKAVLFDMDGTITRPTLDFAVLRQRVGVPPGVTIMDHIESLQGEPRQRAEAILEREEFAATERAELNPGAAELLRDLQRRGLRRALVTNNHRRAMDHVVQRHGLDFDVLLSREDGPAKPAPDLLHCALGALGLDPGQVCFVGDGRFDQLASAAAGIRYIHLSPAGTALDGAPLITHLSDLWPCIGLSPPRPPSTA